MPAFTGVTLLPELSLAVENRHAELAIRPFAKPQPKRTLVLVKSPFGISQAVITRRESSWPPAVALRLYLKGLSSFRVSTDKRDSTYSRPRIDSQDAWRAITSFGGDLCGCCWWTTTGTCST